MSLRILTFLSLFVEVMKLIQLILFHLLFTCFHFKTQAIHWRFHHYSVNDGLSQGNVTALTTDYLGVIWIGTWDGLNVYDGFSNVIFNEQANSKHSLKGSLVNSIHESKQQIMYVATSTCLNEYQRNLNRFNAYSINHYAQDYRIVSEEGENLIVSIDQVLWVFSKRNKSFSKFQNQITHDWNRFFKLSKSAVNHGEYLYVNLYTLMKQSSDRFLALSSFFNQHVLNDIVMHNGEIYLATDEGLYVDDGKSIPVLISEPIKIKCLAIHENKLISGSQTKGLLVFDITTHSQIMNFAYDERNRNSLSGDFVRTLFVDHNEVLWISTLGNGVNYTSLKPHAVRTILGGFDTALLQIKDRYIKNLCEDAKGQLWVVTLSGNIYVLDSTYQIIKRIQPEDIDNKLKPNSFQQIIYNKKYGLYLLSEQGLYTETKPFHFTKIENEGMDLAQSYLNSMAAFNDSTFLLSTRNGLCTFQPKKNASLKPESQMGKARVILSNYTDNKGNTYINPMFAGIEIYNRMNGQFVLSRTIPIACNVKHYFEDVDTLWMATTKGIIKLLTTNFTYTVLDQSTGLPNQYVYCFLKDPKLKNTYWLSSNRGIFRYHSVSKSLYALGLEDGLNSLEFNTHAFAARQNGDVVFGSTDGLCIVKPNGFKTNLLINEVKLSHFKILGESNDLSYDAISGVYQIPYQKNGFSAKLIRISYPAEKTLIRYRLQGYDESILENNNPAELRYSNLPIGKYKFQIELLNSFGQSTWKNLALIEVVAPWYLSWWTFIIYVSIVLSGIYWIVNLFLKWKMQEKEAEQNRQALLMKERDRISVDLHDDIGSTLSSVSIYNELISANIKSNPSVIPKLSEQITKQIQELMLRTEDIIWSLKIGGIMNESLKKRVKEYASELLESKQILVEILIDEMAEDLLQNPEQRRSILMMIKEAMNNCSKYSAASNFSLQIQIEHKVLNIFMFDNGIGFDMAINDFGDGISNIKERCRLMKGEMNIKSGPGRGTQIICSIPIATFS